MNSNRHEKRPRNLGDTTCEALTISKGVDVHDRNAFLF